MDSNEAKKGEFVKERDLKTRHQLEKEVNIKSSLCVLLDFLVGAPRLFCTRTGFCFY